MESAPAEVGAVAVRDRSFHVRAKMHKAGSGRLPALAR
jgi:hypothetical protein